MAIRIMDSIKTANDSTEFPVAFGDSIWLNKDKNGATEDYSDLQTMYNNDELGNGGSSIQVDTMPIASVDELGKIYEFIGSTGTYVNGYFYECVSDGEPTPTYSWVQKNVQPNAESFTFNSDEFAVDSTTNEVSLKPSYADIPSFLPNNVSSSNKLATNSNITAITNLIPSDASASNKLVTKNDLADKQDFRIFNSLEEFNEKKGTSLTVVSGIDNMKDIANAMSNGEMLIFIIKYDLGSEVYFGLTTDTGWTKMFTFVKSNGLCDVECRTTYPLTLKRVLNSDGVVGDWQELATIGKLGELPLYSGNLNDLHSNGFAKYRATYSDLTNAPTVSYSPQMCYIDVWSDTANIYQMIRIVGVTYNPIADYSNTYIRSSHYTGSEYVWSAWGEIATMDKVNALHKQTVGYIEGDLLSSTVKSANLYYQKFGDRKLVINGWVSLGSAVSTQGTKIFTLPNGWKTDSNYLLPCYTPNSNSAYACMIDISTSDVKSYTPLPSGVELRFCAEIYIK